MTKEEYAHISLPDAPGIYFFVKGSTVLYVGKATSLRDRTRSYFASDLAAARGRLIVDMVEKARGLKYLETDSVLEALIAEANYIKKYKPKYNTDEKDNKSFNYVVFTDETFPRIVVVRGRELASGNFDLPVIHEFGPFPNGGSLKEALSILRKIFPFRDKRSGTAHVDRFYAQLGLSPDISDAEAKKTYGKTIRHMVLFFQGKKKTVLSLLEKEMNKAAKEKKFEEANAYKKQIFALSHIRDVALIKEDVQGYFSSVEAFDVAHMAGDSRVGVLTVVENGIPEKSRYRKFIIRAGKGNNDIEALREILDRRLGHPEWRMPALFVVDGGKAQRNAALSMLSEKGIEIPVVSVVKDEFHRPKQILGDDTLVQKYERDILLANAEAHRFAVAYHRNMMRRGLRRS